MAITDSILSLKSLVRSARNIAAADIDKALDEIGALVNQRGELVTAVTKLKDELSGLEKAVSASKAERAVHDAAVKAAVDAKTKAEDALRIAKSELQTVKTKIAAVLA